MRILKAKARSNKWTQRDRVSAYESADEDKPWQLPNVIFRSFCGCRGHVRFSRPQTAAQRRTGRTGLSSVRRFQPANIAACTYVLLTNAAIARSGDPAVRTTSYGRINSPSSE